MDAISLRYGGGTVDVRVPAPARAVIVHAREAPRAPHDLGRGLVEAALERPHGAPPLSQAARGARRATVVIPDGTRPAATPVWLGAVLERLLAAGLAARDVRVLVGGGLHAAPSPARAAALAGALPEGVGLGTTSADDASQHVEVLRDAVLGPVRLHRAVAEADLVVLCGAVAPHYLAGWSGGAKALVPGCADRATIAAAHRLTLDATVAPDGSVRALSGATGRNAFRDALERVARAFGRTTALCLAVRDGAVTAADAGDVVLAHRAAVARAARASGVGRPEPADVVVVGGGAPRDGDLVQAHKSLVVADGVAREGAPVVWLAHAESGAGGPEFLRWFEAGRLERHLAALRRAFHPYGLTAYALRWKAARRPIHVVSTLPRDVLLPMGLHPFATAQAALDHALVGREAARVLVLPEPFDVTFVEPEAADPTSAPGTSPTHSPR